MSSSTLKIIYKEKLSDGTFEDIFELPFSKHEIVSSLINYKNGQNILEITTVNNDSILVWVNTIAKIEVCDND